MKSWYMAGSHPQDYEFGIDDTVTYNGKRSAYIKSAVAQPEGFGTIMQTFKADAYRNKRMRFAAVVKSDTIDGWAGLWMRVDGPSYKEVLAFDNMKDRPITGTTDWQTCEVVLDVPPEGSKIAFGILLHGRGQAWLSDLSFEEVDDTVPVTASRTEKQLADHPGNLDFSESEA